MSKQSNKELLKKYKEGFSSLKEEKYLLDAKNEIISEFDLLASFLKKNNQKVPENLNEQLWDSFDKKINKKKKFKIGILSAAASIVFLISIFFFNNNQNTLTYNEKEALLNEAKSMFNNTNKEEVYTKLLEDELVVVYVKTK